MAVVDPSSTVEPPVAGQTSRLILVTLPTNPQWQEPPLLG